VPFEGRLRAVSHARLLFAGRRLRSDRRGRLTVVARPRRTGRRRVVATASGVLPGRTVVRVHR
jgi:acyl-coenzyme A thioesterase PaaI-like protein